jgi:hypothetical protein
LWERSWVRMPGPAVSKVWSVARAARGRASGLPAQKEAWADLKVTYRHFGEAGRHLSRHRAPPSATDPLAATPLDPQAIHRRHDGTRRRVYCNFTGLTPIGNGGGPGFLMHSAAGVHPVRQSNAASPE